MTNTMSTPDTSRTSNWRLSVSLCRTEGGPDLTREPVTASDLSGLHSEAWLPGCLRQGCPTLPLAVASLKLVPITCFSECPLSLYHFILTEGMRNACNAITKTHNDFFHQFLQPVQHQ